MNFHRSFSSGLLQLQISLNLRHFKLSTDALLTKELTINDLYKFDVFKASDYKKGEPSDHLPDKDAVVEQTPLVSSDMVMEYIVNHTNKDFINGLPSFQFPFIENASTRAFQVDGQEMEYENCGIHNSDILLCARVGNDEELVNGNLYVLVSDDSIRVRRLSDQNRNLTFKTDNPAYPILHYSRNALLEIWKVRAYYSRRLEAPSRMEERITALEVQLQQLLKAKDKK